jgi:hypothetical protein
MVANALVVQASPTAEAVEVFGEQAVMSAGSKASPERPGRATAASGVVIAGLEKVTAELKMIFFNPAVTLFNPAVTLFNPAATSFNPAATSFNPAVRSSAAGTTYRTGVVLLESSSYR